MTRRLSPQGLADLERFEGCRLAAYTDTGRVWTIGYGHTGADVFPGLRWSQKQADYALLADVAEAEDAIDRFVKVPLTDGQFAALVCFTLNVGRGALASSTLLRKLNAGDYAAVPGELARWNKVRGNISTGLINRRAAEIEMWQAGSSPVIPAAFAAEGVALEPARAEPPRWGGLLAMLLATVQAWLADWRKGRA